MDPWDKFQDALADLAKISKDSLSAEQVITLAIGASNLLQVARNGTAQPELYQLKRSKVRQGLSARTRGTRSYERTRRPAPVQKQKRGRDGRVVVHKRQHKQIRLTKDVGLCTVLVRLNAIVLLY